MAQRRGKLIVIDGIDKVGKATQTALLLTRLKKEKRKVVSIAFPQYEGNFFGRLLGECLAGKRGDFLSLDPKIASVLYAADRFETKPKIERYLQEGYLVISDRYVSANQIHQGGKIRSRVQRAEFLKWLDKLEYQKFGLPRPDMTIHLTLPASFRAALLTRAKTSVRGADTVEKSARYNRNSDAAAAVLASELKWEVISCAKNGKLLSKEEVHEKVYEAIRNVL